MDDPHQVNTIIATAICDFLRGCPEQQVGAEEAKLLGKQIVEALNAANLSIVVTQPAEAVSKQ